MKILLYNTNLATQSVITQLKKNEKFVVITDQKNIVELLELLNFDNVEVLYVRSGFTILELPDLIKSKKIIKELFINNSFSDLIFYHQAFGGFYNWIIAYAHKNNVIISYHRVVKKIDGANVYSISALKCKLSYALLYQTEVKIVRIGGGGFSPKLTDRFFKKNHVKEKWAVYDDNIVSSVGRLIMSKLNIPICENKVLLLTGSVVSTNRVNIEDYCKKMEILIDTIGRDNIVCKCHPRFDDEIEVEKKLPHLPSFVPMELLGDLFSVYIGFASSVLINVAKQGKKSVSLINYLDIDDEVLRNTLSNYLADSGVIFIEKIYELKKILSNYEIN